MNDAQVGGQIVSPGRVGGQPHRVGTHSVVSVAKRENVVVSGVDASHHHGHVVGLGARVDEVAHFQVSRHGGDEPPGVLVDLRVEINGGRVPQLVHLGVQSGVDFRMTMTDADGDDAAEEIQIALAVGVPQPLHGTAVDVKRAGIVVSHRWAQVCVANRYHLGISQA